MNSNDVFSHNNEPHEIGINFNTPEINNKEEIHQSKKFNDPKIRNNQN